MVLIWILKLTRTIKPILKVRKIYKTKRTAKNESDKRMKPIGKSTMKIESRCQTVKKKGMNSVNKRRRNVKELKLIPMELAVLSRKDQRL